MEKIIYKICPTLAWHKAIKAGVYAGSSDDQRDGFIHFSCADQLAGTLAKHYVGQSDLLLIAIGNDRLGDDLKWETSRGGQLFPHLYATLDPSIALSAQHIELGPHGHVIPDLREQNDE